MTSVRLLNAHPGRAAALGELHARPAPAVDCPAQVSRLVFLQDDAVAKTDQRAIDIICRRAGVAAPARDARHHSIHVDGRELRWERHTEFVSYTFISPGDSKTPAVWEGLTDDPEIVPLHRSLLTLMTVAVAAGATDEGVGTTVSCRSDVAAGRAQLSTDFNAGPDGFVRFDLRHDGLTPAEIGTLCQTIMEIETYRMLALIALPVARNTGAFVQDMEQQLAALTRRIEAESKDDNNARIFTDSSALAARIEAEIAATTYRFAATKAYGAIVEDRLKSLNERPHGGEQMPGAFLQSRLTPALRTCDSMNLALANLAQRCARATSLIRTRIDLQLTQQNNRLLGALNERTRMQMRLQQTVEGLSIIAISYYAIGLIGYLAKGAKDAGLTHVDPSVAIAVAVPVVIAGVAFVITRIRRAHSRHE